MASKAGRRARRWRAAAGRRPVLGLVPSPRLTAATRTWYAAQGSNAPWTCAHRRDANLTDLDLGSDSSKAGRQKRPAGRTVSRPADPNARGRSICERPRVRIAGPRTTAVELAIVRGTARVASLFFARRRMVGGLRCLRSTRRRVVAAPQLHGYEQSARRCCLSWMQERSGLRGHAGTRSPLVRRGSQPRVEPQTGDRRFDRGAAVSTCAPAARPKRASV